MTRRRGRATSPTTSTRRVRSASPFRIFRREDNETNTSSKIQSSSLNNTSPVSIKTKSSHTSNQSERTEQSGEPKVNSGVKDNVISTPTSARQSKHLSTSKSKSSPFGSLRKKIKHSFKKGKKKRPQSSSSALSTSTINDSNSHISNNNEHVLNDEDSDSDSDSDSDIDDSEERDPVGSNDVLSHSEQFRDDISFASSTRHDYLTMIPPSKLISESTGRGRSNNRNQGRIQRAESAESALGGRNSYNEQNGDDDEEENDNFTVHKEYFNVLSQLKILQQEPNDYGPPKKLKQNVGNSAGMDIQNVVEPHHKNNHDRMHELQELMTRQTDADEKSKHHIQTRIPTYPNEGDSIAPKVHVKAQGTDRKQDFGSNKAEVSSPLNGTPIGIASDARQEAFQSNLTRLQNKPFEGGNASVEIGRQISNFKSLDFTSRESNNTTSRPVGDLVTSFPSVATQRSGDSVSASSSSVSKVNTGSKKSKSHQKHKPVKKMSSITKSKSKRKLFGSSSKPSFEAEGKGRKSQPERRRNFGFLRQASPNRKKISSASLEKARAHAKQLAQYAEAPSTHPQSLSSQQQPQQYAQSETTARRTVDLQSHFQHQQSRHTAQPRLNFAVFDSDSVISGESSTAYNMDALDVQDDASSVISGMSAFSGKKKIRNAQHHHHQVQQERFSSPENVFHPINMKNRLSSPVFSSPEVGGSMRKQFVGRSPGGAGSTISTGSSMTGAAARRLMRRGMNVSHQGDQSQFVGSSDASVVTMSSEVESQYSELDDSLEKKHQRQGVDHQNRRPPISPTPNSQHRVKNKNSRSFSPQHSDLMESGFTFDAFGLDEREINNEVDAALKELAQSNGFDLFSSERSVSEVGDSYIQSKSQHERNNSFRTSLSSAFGKASQSTEGTEVLTPTSSEGPSFEERQWEHQSSSSTIADSSAGLTLEDEKGIENSFDKERGIWFESSSTDMGVDEQFENKDEFQQAGRRPTNASSIRERFQSSNLPDIAFDERMTKRDREDYLPEEKPALLGHPENEDLIDDEFITQSKAYFDESPVSLKVTGFTDGSRYSGSRGARNLSKAGDSFSITTANSQQRRRLEEDNSLGSAVSADPDSKEDLYFISKPLTNLKVESASQKRAQEWAMQRKAPIVMSPLLVPNYMQGNKKVSASQKRAEEWAKDNQSKNIILQEVEHFSTFSDLPPPRMDEKDIGASVHDEQKSPVGTFRKKLPSSSPRRPPLMPSINIDEVEAVSLRKTESPVYEPDYNKFKTTAPSVPLRKVQRLDVKKDKEVEKPNFLANIRLKKSPIPAQRIALELQSELSEAPSTSNEQLTDNQSNQNEQVEPSLPPSKKLTYREQQEILKQEENVRRESLSNKTVEEKEDVSVLIKRRVAANKKQIIHNKTVLDPIDQQTEDIATLRQKLKKTEPRALNSPNLSELECIDNQDRLKSNKMVTMSNNEAGRGFRKPQESIRNQNLDNEDSGRERIISIGDMTSNMINNVNQTSNDFVEVGEEVSSIPDSVTPSIHNVSGLFARRSSSMKPLVVSQVDEVADCDDEQFSQTDEKPSNERLSALFVQRTAMQPTQTDNFDVDTESDEEMAPQKEKKEEKPSNEKLSALFAQRASTQPTQKPTKEKALAPKDQPVTSEANSDPTNKLSALFAQRSEVLATTKRKAEADGKSEKEQHGVDPLPDENKGLLALFAQRSEKNKEESRTITIEKVNETVADGNFLNETQNSTSQNSMALKDDPACAKYFKMLKMGLPLEVVKHAMTRDGIDPDMLDGDPNKPVEMNESGVPLKEDPKYTKYFKMLKLGLPMGAVKNAMERDGEDPTVMDGDHNASAAGSTEQIKSKKPEPLPKDKYRRTRLHWDILRQVKKSSVWALVNEDPDIEQIEIDENEFAELFQVEISATPQLDVDSSKKKNAVKVIDPKRANNGGIILARLKITYEEMAVAVDRIDETVMTAEQMQGIAEYIPTKEEKHALRKYMTSSNKDSADAFDDLCECEKFMVAMMTVKHSKEKVRAILFKLQFRQCIEDIEGEANIVEKACDELLQSVRLRKLLGIVLNIGNRLNTAGPTRKGKAGAFTIKSLSKLNQAKAVDKKTTFLHYVALVVQRHNDSLANFKDDLPSVLQADKVYWDQCTADLEEVENQLENVRKIALNVVFGKKAPWTRKKKGGNDDDLSHQSMTLEEEVEALRSTNIGIFTLDAIKAVSALRELVENTNTKLGKLLEYFGEENIPPHELFGILSKFVRDFDEAKEKVAKLQKEKVKKEKKGNKGEEKARKEIPPKVNSLAQKKTMPKKPLRASSMQPNLGALLSARKSSGVEGHSTILAREKNNLHDEHSQENSTSTTVSTERSSENENSHLQEEIDSNSVGHLASESPSSHDSNNERASDEENVAPNHHTSENQWNEMTGPIQDTNVPTINDEDSFHRVISSTHEHEHHTRISSEESNSIASPNPEPYQMRTSLSEKRVSHDENDSNSLSPHRPVRTTESLKAISTSNDKRTSRSSSDQLMRQRARAMRLKRLQNQNKHKSEPSSPLSHDNSNHARSISKQPEHRSHAFADEAQQSSPPNETKAPRTRASSRTKPPSPEDDRTTNKIPSEIHHTEKSSAAPKERIMSRRERLARRNRSGHY